MGYDLSMNTKEKQHTIAGLFVLLLIMGIAVILRLVGITKESLWWDEYASHVYLNTPTLSDFLAWNLSLDPLSLPSYYSLEYWWTHYVHDSVLSLRLLSVLIGVAVIPLVYGLGRRMVSRRAGLLAAALVALSPNHIHHAQGIRAYVLFIFLTALVVWTFIRLLEERRLSWWAAHAIACLLLYWTHAFSVLLPLSLGIFLLFRLKVWRGFLFQWGIVQVILLAPTAFYLSTLRFWPQDTTARWIALPGVLSLGADLFFDDISAFHWQFRLGAIAASLGSLRVVVDLVFAVLILVGLLQVAASGARKKTQDSASKNNYGLLLYLWLLIPPISLFILSWTMRPCMFPRYTIHSTLALYLLLGAAFGASKIPGRRLVLPLLLCGLMFLQWFWLQPGPQRSDWRSAALFLQEQAAPHDVLLVKNRLSRNIFLHNMEVLTPQNLEIPVASASTYSLLAAQTALCLGILPSETEDTRVWVLVAMDYFEPGPPLDFERYLEEWSIPFERWSFPAIREIYVYRTERGETALPDSIEALYTDSDIKKDSLAGDLEHHSMQAFGELATALALQGEREAAKEIFDGIFKINTFAKEIYGNFRKALDAAEELDTKAAAIETLWQAYGLRKNVQPRLMLQAFQKAAALDPMLALAHVEIGLELAQQGTYTEAREALLLAMNADDRYRDMLSSLVDALANGQDIPAKLSAVMDYREALLALSTGDTEKAQRMLQHARATDPQLVAAQLMLAYVWVDGDSDEDVEALLQQYLSATDRPLIDSFAYLALILTEHNNLDRAANTLNMLFEKDPQTRKTYDSLAKALASGEGVSEAALSIRSMWEGFDAAANAKEEQALSAFAKAVEINPDNNPAALELALHLVAAKRQEEALPLLLRVAEKDPDYRTMTEFLIHDIRSGADTTASLNGINAYRRGILAQSRGEYEEAVTALEEAVQADPRLEAAHTSRVFNLIILRRFEEAMAGLNRYLDGTEHPSPGAFGLLTVLYIANKDTEQAVESYRTAMSMDDSYAQQFGPIFFAALEMRDYDKLRQEMDQLKKAGVDLYPLMDEITRDYLANTEPRSEAEIALQKMKEENRYWADMQRFAEEDEAETPVPGDILFTGSSTARMWDVKKFFPDLPVVNRGFGGSVYKEVTLFHKEIVRSHKPSILVLYSGDNDVFRNETAEETAQDGLDAVDALRTVAPKAQIIVISTKPSASRWQYAPVMLAANGIIAEQLATRENMIFVDLVPLLLDEKGLPDPVCFRDDELHLSDEGYRRWSEALRPYLIKAGETTEN